MLINVLSTVKEIFLFLTVCLIFLQIATIRGHTSPKLVLQMIPHQGLVYNVLVRDSYEKSEAAYVPAFAYDCDINNVETCKSFGKFCIILTQVSYSRARKWTERG